MSTPSPPRATLFGLLLLSAAALAFQVTLTRLFSVAQFYHFAFMIVSVAMLGYGASGTWLAIMPNLARMDPRRSLGWLALLTSLSILGAYLLINLLPFDSFSIAVDRRQIGILVLHYLALATPFFFSGMAVGLLLAAFPQESGKTYAFNLLGAATGCALALAAPSFLGSEGMVTLSAGLAALAAVGQFDKLSYRLAAITFLLFTFYDAALRLSGHPLPLLELRLSPYKSLSYALQYPGAEVIYRRWNAFSRVDVVRSPGIHSLPGLSYRYLQPLPTQDGLLVDGDNLSGILPANVKVAFTDHLPAAIAFQLRPAADTLILEPRGGLDILTALAHGARQVTAVEVNPLIVAAAPVYADPRLRTVIESDRSYLRRTDEHFDVILLSLASSYHPVRSGAYSLAEDYRYTVESFTDALERLKSDGLLVVARWLQDPPSEDLRAFALAVTALEKTGGDPRSQIVAFRGYNTATILVKGSLFTLDELLAIHSFTAERAFDMTYAPDIRPEETNRYNILPESSYYQAYTALLDASPRAAFYAAYPYDVSPPTDDHPFFGHYFKWSQAGQVWAELGQTWQPFGGAGYFVILALLALSILLACTLILLPLVIRKSSRQPFRHCPEFIEGCYTLSVTGQQSSIPRHPSPALSLAEGSILRHLFYFTFIGLAFMLVEIPLIQRFILYLGHPAYAMSAVIFSLLLFSALGSRLSHRIPLRLALLILVILLVFTPFLLPYIFTLTLGLPFLLRLALTALILAPLGFLMGIPFPAGIRWVTEKPSGIHHPPSATLRLRSGQVRHPPSAIPWLWAVNGVASVVASVLAALLALTFGFSWVLRIGALCYLAAWITEWVRPRPASSPRPHR
ncbi:MAG: hypothetical protein QMD04_12390 [Anaerolineales bacterium]|nr:hypothetical protein [Anaerolineales bacterium]